MNYQSRITIKETEDVDVARALAYLAGFREYDAHTRSPSPHQGAGREAIIFHQETIEKDPDLFLATQNPDIIVTRFLGDEYLIEFDDGRVDPQLIGKIEQEIKRVYAKLS